MGKNGKYGKFPISSQFKKIKQVNRTFSPLPIFPHWRLKWGMGNLKFDFPQEIPHWGPLGTSPNIDIMHYELTSSNIPLLSTPKHL